MFLLRMFYVVLCVCSLNLTLRANTAQVIFNALWEEGGVKSFLEGVYSHKWALYLNGQDQICIPETLPDSTPITLVFLGNQNAYFTLTNLQPFPDVFRTLLALEEWRMQGINRTTPFFGAKKDTPADPDSDDVTYTAYTESPGKATLIAKSGDDRWEMHILVSEAEYSHSAVLRNNEHPCSVTLPLNTKTLSSFPPWLRSSPAQG